MFTFRQNIYTRVKLRSTLDNKLAVIRQSKYVDFIVGVFKIYQRGIFVKSPYKQIVCRIGIKVGKERLVVGV